MNGRLSPLLLAGALMFGAAVPGWAEGIDFSGQSGLPVEVYADQGLELSQDAKTVIATGNAKAIRGRVTVTADRLIAHYRQRATPAGAAEAPKPTPASTKPTADGSADTGNNEIWRLEADGHVVIFTDTQRAYGDHADYNIDDAVVVLTGKDLRLTTADETVTARDSLEYWDKRQQAVARGDAVATRRDKKIQADTLVADYGPDKAGHTVMRHATAFDHVILTSPTEIATGKRADYDPIGDIVTITGAVKITRGQNQLDGEYAVVNLDTGISRLFPTIPGGAATTGIDSQVRGLLVPEHNSKPRAGSVGGGTATERPPEPAHQP